MLAGRPSIRTRRQLNAKNRILVTGGSGFIGTNLVNRLLERGEVVLSIDVKSPRILGHEDHFVNVDLLDAEALTAVVAEFKPSAVVHLGARTDLDGRTSTDYVVNTAGTQNLIHAAHAAGAVEFVAFASSRLVCDIGYQPKGDEDYMPSTAYGQSKAEGERIVRRECGNEFSWTIFRPTSIWGPWFGVPYSIFFETVAAGRYTHPRGRRIRKSFGYVGNSVHQLIRLIDDTDRQLNGQTIYLGDDPPIEVLSWAQAVAEATGARPPRQLPVAFLRGAAAIGDLLEVLTGRKAPLTSFRLKNLLTEMLYDLGPINRIAGPAPIQMEEAIAATVEWMRATDRFSGADR